MNVGKKIFRTIGNEGSGKFSHKRRRFEVSQGRFSGLAAQKIRSPSMRVTTVYPVAPFHLSSSDKQLVDKTISQFPIPTGFGGRVRRPFERDGRPKGIESLFCLVCSLKF